MYFICFYIESFKSCFELKTTNEKGNHVSYFFRFCLLHALFRSNYLFTQGLTHSQKFINYKRAPALSCDLFYVSLDRLIQNLFQVKNHH